MPADYLLKLVLVAVFLREERRTLLQNVNGPSDCKFQLLKLFCAFQQTIESDDYARDGRPGAA